MPWGTSRRRRVEVSSASPARDEAVGAVLQRRTSQSRKRRSQRRVSSVTRGSRRAGGVVEPGREDPSQLAVQRQCLSLGGVAGLGPLAERDEDARVVEWMHGDAGREQTGAQSLGAAEFPEHGLAQEGEPMGAADPGAEVMAETSHAMCFQSRMARAQLADLVGNAHELSQCVEGEAHVT